MTRCQLKLCLNPNPSVSGSSHNEDFIIKYVTSSLRSFSGTMWIIAEKSAKQNGCHMLVGMKYLRLIVHFYLRCPMRSKILAWIGNYMPIKVRIKLLIHSKTATGPSPRYIMDEITYPCRDWNYSMLEKGNQGNILYTITIQPCIDITNISNNQVICYF